MSLFGPPKCPHCGSKLKFNSGSVGVPTWRCDNCIERNREKRERANKIKELEDRIAKLETAVSQEDQS